MPKKEECKNCKYWDKDFENCHRFPPVSMTWGDRYNDIEQGFSFPSVDKDECCGEYQPKNNAKNKNKN